MTIRLFGTEFHVATLLITTGLALTGALIARLIYLPLPWLLGAVIAVGAGALFNFKPLGHNLQFPIKLREFFVPIIGVMIGGAFTPQLVGSIPDWWPTVLALLIYVPLAHTSSYLIYYKLGGYDQKTAFFSGMPGGLIEAIVMGEEVGADSVMVTMLQFCRLLLCIIIVPIAFTVVEGGLVGSASGVSVGGAGKPDMTAYDAVILAACAVIGYLGFKRLRLPAAVIAGPIFVSGLAHLAGLTAAQPPAFLIAMTQLVVGATLGVRFVTIDRHQALKGLRLAFLSISSVLSLAVIFAFVLFQFVGEPMEAVVLAYSPGGVTEMSLIALSLQISVVFVSLHHLARIIMTILIARIAYRVLIGRTVGTSP